MVYTEEDYERVNTDIERAKQRRLKREHLNKVSRHSFHRGLCIGLMVPIVTVFAMDVVFADRHHTSADIFAAIGFTLLMIGYIFHSKKLKEAIHHE